MRTGFHLPTITRKASPSRTIISKLLAIKKVLLFIIFSGVLVCPAPHLHKEDSSAFSQFANMRIHLRSKCLCSPHCICSWCPTALSQFSCPAQHPPQCNLIFPNQTNSPLQMPGQRHLCGNKLARGEGLEVHLLKEEVNASSRG